MGDSPNGTMDEEQFNSAVADLLENRERTEVARMSRQYDKGMACMSSATVAGEEGLSLTDDSVAEVADAREWWYDEHHEPAMQEAHE